MGQLVVADISGGKDSVAMCLRLVEEGVHVDAFIFADTGFDFPEALDAIARFEELSGRKVERLKPERDFVEVAARIETHGKFNRPRGYGWPSWRRRWCNYELKRRSILAFDRANGFPEHLIGIAADEPQRIRRRARVRYPLVDWGMTEADCLTYCRASGFYPPGGIYDFRSRIGCFICPLQRVGEARWMMRSRPELWARIRVLEQEIGEPWKGRGTAGFEISDGEHLSAVD